MKLEHGLMSGQVLQRGADDKGATRLRGSAAGAGDVDARLLRGKRILRGHDWRTVGVAADGCFMAELSGIPAGGPYTLALRVRVGTRVLEDLLLETFYVGDVWILGGQSNMEGVGNLRDAPRPHQKVRAFYMRDEWALAAEKLHFLPEAVDAFHNGYGSGEGRPERSALDRVRSRLVKGTGPGLAFGLEMYRRTRVPQGLIPCAHGGTSMDQWSPALREQGGRSLYGAMMRRYEKLGQKVAGVIWYQGESDANPESVDSYSDKMARLVEATRRDMGLPKLPWVVVQIGCHACATGDQEWNNIQEQQRGLPQKIKRLDVVPSIDLSLDDGIHISGASHHRLGCRLARAADKLVCKPRGEKGGIRLKNLACIPTPDCNAGADCTAVTLSFSNVVGGLWSPGKPAGFSLVDKEGRDVKGVYKITVKGSRVLLHTNMAPMHLKQLSVCYGLGRFPHCNIVDRDGMSLPVMYRVPVST